MGMPMTLMHVRPKGCAAIQTPLLGFLAGPHAGVIAEAWPAPHSGFLTLPTARRHAAAILLASRMQAAIAGRDFVTPDDVKDMARPVLEHRLILRPEYEIEGLTVPEVIGRIVEEVTVPR